MNGNSTIWTDEMISFLKANFFKLTNAQLAKGCGTVMEKEYSNEVRGKVHAYRFTTLEKETIAEALQPFIKKWQAKIDKVDNHPNNEGQATFMCERVRLINEQKDLQEIIEEFKKK